MNEIAANDMNERKIMMNVIVKIKIKLIGHLHNQFITIIMDEKINGKRTK